MDIKEYIIVVLRWVGFLAIGLVVGVQVGFLVNIFQISAKRASALVLRASLTEENTDISLGDQQHVRAHDQLLTVYPEFEYEDSQGAGNERQVVLFEDEEFLDQIKPVISPTQKIHSSAGGLSKEIVFQTAETNSPVLPKLEEIQDQTFEVLPTTHLYGDPAGCGESASKLTIAEMLSNVQAQLPELDLAPLRVQYVWNGTLNRKLEASKDPFVVEFAVDMYKPPSTYLADKAVTVFLENGFVVWLRSYDGHFRLMAVPMIDGVNESVWGEYVKAYWSADLLKDQKIYPVMKKLPCHWMIDEGWVSNETINMLFDLDWQIPDYLINGRKYLASNCEEANRVSQEMIGYWDAASMCGPLAWTLLRDANSFPYRIGSWYASAEIFKNANPKWNGRPWAGFDPETFTLIRSNSSMPGYDFATKGNLYKGDIVYSYSTLYSSDDENFDHIFLVGDVNEHGQRISITNTVQISPKWNCFINEVVLYMPGDVVNGEINNEWNSATHGRTGLMGFDVFRWKWITYHLNGESVNYTVRYGDTLETIGFDWKVSPQEIINANSFAVGSQLVPGQTIVLPALINISK